ncbi:DSD1 family PLP-dependent enzyme [Pectobacterium aroidearum]|uniref:DSD1 family PLP-dependent enzyme n=1 Tax=Pectobacterium aroidearum TaxID=1201031 RepID=UPI0021148A4F|nr:DSD1 family PLP-dependent enzyme [Pectobacterium aroidearum]UUE46897.1 DSD1 family PLP-dependent enzyme [Pectobacterium aroidearum]UUE51094.1 DSD1 family PLP-dependent enzyme [Pectobacterium aroidearum]UUE55323.1 DSD1 family PLP-dependent enzyme [Pectobacterium aroidearum]UUE63731.1 DSD1 family PLP-dependent enzyme [Pectobacterium aroidearum]UUE67956.1 DSD1 family PLP-dependent enzyme [Pectobacterium aroidearum]
MNNIAWLNALETPFLLIDEFRFQRNIDRLYQRTEALGSRIRPHLKTLRSIEAGRYLLKDANSPATVSTLAEAEAFAEAGYTNLLYAVGIAPHKLPRIANLIRNGVNIHILLDSAEQAQAVVDFARANSVTFSVFIEIDCDGHRGGIPPESDALLALAKQIDGNGATLTGLLAHAGESYACRTDEAIREAARAECEAINTAGRRVRALGIACPELSVGATPTAHFAEDLTGVTEVRAGVFTTFDLVMKNVGVCALDDIALSVVSTVIGHNREKGWVFIDAGWMALSRDRGTASQAKDYGYGLVCDLYGSPYNDLCVTTTNQEHGIITLPVDSGLAVDHFPVGTRLRILPNHACATAAMHQHYQVLKSHRNAQETWQRIIGW